MPDMDRERIVDALANGNDHAWWLRVVYEKAEIVERLITEACAEKDAERQVADRFRECEIERLRARTHEIAEAKDAEHAARARELALLLDMARKALEAIRESTRDPFDPVGAARTAHEVADVVLGEAKT